MAFKDDDSNDQMDTEEEKKTQTETDKETKPNFRSMDWFACALCKQVFRQKLQLKEHKKLLHSIEKKSSSKRKSDSSPSTSCSPSLNQTQNQNETAVTFSQANLNTSFSTTTTKIQEASEAQKPLNTLGSSVPSSLIFNSGQITQQQLIPFPWQPNNNNNNNLNVAQSSSVQVPPSSSSSLCNPNPTISTCSTPTQNETGAELESEFEAGEITYHLATNLNENEGLWEEGGAEDADCDDKDDEDDENVGVTFESICVPKNPNDKKYEAGLEMEMNFEPSDLTKSFKCSYLNCPRRFADRHALKRHLLIHIDKRPFRCYIPACPMTFRRSDHVLAHIRNVHLPKPAKNNSNSQQQQLQQQQPLDLSSSASTSTSIQQALPVIIKPIIIHHNRNSNNNTSGGTVMIAPSTGWCNDIISSNLTSTRAREISTDSTAGIEIPSFEECPICEKILKTKKTLQGHLKLHEASRFVCPHCRKMFPEKHYLNEHVRHVHLPEQIQQRSKQ